MPMPIAKPSTTMSAVNAPSSSTTNAVSTALLTAAPLGDPASGDASAKATAAVPCRYKGQCTDANCVFLHPPVCKQLFFGVICAFIILLFLFRIVALASAAAIARAHSRIVDPISQNING